MDEKTDLSKVLEKLELGSYRPRIVTDEDIGWKDVSWRSLKSTYKISFDEKGSVVEADIDGVTMRQIKPTSGLEREWWMYSGAGGDLRVMAFERWLGFPLFKDR